MLSTLLLSVLLSPLLQDTGLPRSGVPTNDLEKFAKDVVKYFDALGPDDRAGQVEAIGRLEEELERAGKRIKAERPMLAYVGDWDDILEAAKPEVRELKSTYGKGFSVHVFEDEVNDLRTAALLSIPGTYGKAPERLPVIIGLKPSYGVSGSALEKQAMEAAATLYADVLDSHIVLIPLGHQTGKGRSTETEEFDGSWMSPAGNDVFFTSLRILFEQIRFDRSRVVLDGWGAAGLDALRLATNAPAFFAGVIDRGGEVASPDLALQNLYLMKVLYVKGEGSPSDVSALVDASIEGVTVTEVDSGGSALDPSDEARGAIREWLGTARRNLAQKEIRYHPADVVFGSASWCQASMVNRRVSAVPSDADYPKMYARIDPATNTIVLDTRNVVELRIYLSDALVDMDKTVTIMANGAEVWKSVPKRSLRQMLDNRYFGNSGDYGLYTDSILIEGLSRNIPGSDG